MSEALEPIIGRWTTTGEVLDQAGAVVATLAGTDSYQWLGSAYVMHRAEVDMPDQQVSVLEMIGPWDARREAWPTWVFDGGGESAVEQSFVTLDEEGALVFRAEGAQSVLRPDGDRMTGEWVREAAGGEWVPWMRLSFRRR